MPASLSASLTMDVVFHMLSIMQSLTKAERSFNDNSQTKNRKQAAEFSALQLLMPNLMLTNKTAAKWFNTMYCMVTDFHAEVSRLSRLRENMSSNGTILKA